MAVPVVAMGWALCGGWEDEQFRRMQKDRDDADDKAGSMTIVAIHVIAVSIPLLIAVMSFFSFLYVFFKYRVTKQMLTIKKSVAKNMKKSAVTPEAAEEEEGKEGKEGDEEQEKKEGATRDPQPADGPSTEAAGAAQEDEDRKTMRQSKMKKKKKKKKGTAAGTARQRRDWLKDDDSDDSHESWSSWSSWEPGVGDGAGGLVAAITYQ